MVLQDIKDFLDGNAQEIFTLLIERKANIDDIAQDFIDLGLVDYTWVQPKDQEWPTIAHMIERNKRLVVFLKDDYTRIYPWMNYQGNYMWSTPYQFSCAKTLAQSTGIDPRQKGFQGPDNYNRRHQNPKNTLFAIPHFITIGFAGLPGAADVVNKKKILAHRVRQLRKKAGIIPNFVELDFTQHGDGYMVVRKLNEELLRQEIRAELSGTIPEGKQEDDVPIKPFPTGHGFG